MLMFWAIKEAKKILQKFKNQDEIKLEIGYSPSGKIHIGTFHEAKRTNAIIKAIKTLSNKKCRLICFSDDMDGLRKIPENAPNKDMLVKYIQYPLSQIPDPHQRDNSYAEHYNKNMRNFLDDLNIKYEFMSSTDEYKSGRFNKILQKVYDKYDDIMKVMLPHLREERRKTYSPFLPICKYTNQVLQVPTQLNKEKNTIIFTDYNGNTQETDVFNGKCKLQWKVDFAARWAEKGIHYEMMGKDHTTNIKIYQQLCRILEAEPPLSMMYEMFLNEEGKKISKSDGNKAVSLEDWLQYTIPEALEFFILQYPQRARIMTYNSIIQATDEYISAIKNYKKNDEFTILNAIHDQNIPSINIGQLTFTSVINIINAMHINNTKEAYTVIKKYDNTITSTPFLTKLIQKAIEFCSNYLKATKKYLSPNTTHIQILTELRDLIQKNPEDLETQIYNIGKQYFGKEKLRDFFSTIYQILLGDQSGPRLPSFIKLIGSQAIVKLIDKKLNNK